MESKIDTRSILDKVFNKSSVENDTANKLVASGDWVELSTDYGILLRHETGCTLWWDNDGTPSNHFVLSTDMQYTKVEVCLPFDRDIGFYSQKVETILNAYRLLTAS